MSAKFASPSNNQSAMDAKGFEKLFEFLSLNELKTLRGTCKELKRIVDNHIKTAYPAYKRIKIKDYQLSRSFSMDGNLNDKFFVEMPIDGGLIRTIFFQLEKRHFLPRENEKHFKQS